MDKKEKNYEINLFLEEERDLLEQQGSGGGSYNPNPPEPPSGPDVYYGDYLPIVIDLSFEFMHLTIKRLN